MRGDSIRAMSANNRRRQRYAQLRATAAPVNSMVPEQPTMTARVDHGDPCPACEGSIRFGDHLIWMQRDGDDAPAWFHRSCRAIIMRALARARSTS